MSDGVCLCVFVWVCVDVRRTQLESRCTLHPKKIFQVQQMPRCPAVTGERNTFP